MHLYIMFYANLSTLKSLTEFQVQPYQVQHKSQLGEARVQELWNGVRKCK